MATTYDYQHFIPQFIVKNYAQKVVCPEVGCRGKKGRHRHEKGKHPGDLVVHHVNLTSEPFQLTETPVRRIFGQLGMYMDWGKATTKDQRRIESMLGVMESQASTIFRKIVKAHEAGELSIVLTRTERNLVRKFIFMPKYRGSTYHRRFYHENAQGYSEDDKPLLCDYMSKHGFTTPMDVWFHNLETIATLDMDMSRKWQQELPKRMYPENAMGFIFHIEAMHMAKCQPSQTNEEFIITDNCYNIFEGPNNFSQDAQTGRCIGRKCAPFHEFAPISPKLMIVLDLVFSPSQKKTSTPN